ncbi:MAG: enoyl-CoA hydratase/isomerase family protein [Planctomycetes bacterium]|nr:enoyl-CoA hydratase/isomerase family protein [Planctomycetota bacterium]
MPDYIHKRIAQSVATVTLARADLHNAFNDDMMREIADTFASLAISPDVRVIVLAADGKSYCAGADVNWMKRMVGYTFDENVADANVLARMLRAIRECPKPVIARVHGAAYGGGVGLVAACDIAVASSNSTFSLSEVKLGIVPAVISPFVLEKIGPSAARRYGLTAERFDAAEAKRIGLVNDVVEQADQLDAWIATVAESLIANGPAAIAACKQILSHVAGQMWDDVQAYTTQQIARIRVSPEGQEGLKAFLEKRKANWNG